MISKKKIILIIVLLSYFVTAIDGSIVITGLTKISEELSLSQTELSWVQNAYVLAFGGFILLGGKLSDIFGRKRILNIALMIFGISSAIAGASLSSEIMIGARFFQGVGAAILAPTSLALLMDTFEDDELVEAVAWYSSISGLGSSVGLIIGGYLASYMSWRTGFYINVPITLVMLLMSFCILEGKEVQMKSFDIGGTVLSVTGVFSFVYAINGAKNRVEWILIAIVLITGFILVEKKSKIPIMPLALFSNKTRTCAYVGRAFYMCAMLGFWFFISEYLQNVLGFNPILTGLAFFPMTISLFIAAMFVPKMVKKNGNKIVLLIGVLSLFVGFLCMFFVDENSSYFPRILLPLLFLGFGQGLSMSPLTNLGIYECNDEDSGAASGLVNVAHQVGGSIGLSIMVECGQLSESTLGKFHIAMIIGLVFVILMGGVAIMFPKKM